MGRRGWVATWFLVEVEVEVAVAVEGTSGTLILRKSGGKSFARSSKSW
jgi:hypothetical protein